ncbi:phosphoribosylaminoimidazolesuccinocarboxamide synthase [Candidatus Poribacteria bacterium]|nr:phosphoribosylaminoimidazolesuccinocarboxamide synthase [Candidatus Poribacteria bacterium]
MNDRGLAPFDQLVLSQIEVIRRIGLSILWRRWELDDLVQEVVARVYEYRDHVRDEERVKAWIASVARNTARMWNRKQRPVLTDQVFEIPVPSETVTGRLEAQEHWMSLVTALSQLSETDEELLRAYHLGERSHTELQDEYNVSYGALRTRLTRARGRLRWLLAQPLDAASTCERGHDARAAPPMEEVMSSAIVQTECPDLDLVHRGKVRDIHGLDDRLFLVATDRISAFDVVLPSGITNKGKVLTALSTFWFDYTKELVPNHLLSTDVAEFPAVARQYADTLSGRTMYVLRTDRVDIECVVRGYMSGSAWKEYREHGTVCGARMPSGLVESDRLSEPIFTPATKADTGHDENISIAQMQDIVGAELTERLRKASISIYEAASAYAAERGIIIADTKFEFGERDGEIILIDEVLTSDSSRFWPADEYEPGRPQRSFDKQYVRDYLETLDWGKTYPGPELPADVVAGTSARYQEAYEQLVGEPFLAD